MRSRRAVGNIITTFTLQLVNILSGLIVPSLIIHYYGSDVNGIIVSITQFLNYISLVDGGAGGVIKAALYKPIAENNQKEISGILNATSLFFRKIAYIFLAYVAILIFLYPSIIKTEFSFYYIICLIFILAINTLIRYLFGITNQLLLQADQRGYIPDAFQIIAVLMNTVFTVILIHINASIQMVKFFSVIAFVFPPIMQAFVVKKYYTLNRNEKPHNEAINQRWDGLGQHIAYFVHTNTDIVVLSIFTTVKEVSVYSVYSLVAIGLKNIIYTLSNGFSAAIGNMIAKKEKEILNETYEMLEWINTFFSFVFFSTGIVMILPFIQIYTKGVTDANYVRYFFSILILVAELIYCLRFPIIVTVNSAGHYKQTRNGAFIEAIINISTSLVLVKPLGIEGVAIGTIIGMTYRTIDYVNYFSKNILYRKPVEFIKTISINLFASLTGICILSIIDLPIIYGYMSWLIEALIIGLFFCVISLIMNAIFARKIMIKILMKIKCLFIIQSHI